MINRDEFSKALEEIRNLRALLAFERYSHDTLRKRVEYRRDAVSIIAAGRLREDDGKVSIDWLRDNEEHVALLVSLRST
jgi:hypothetical protein